MQMQEKETCRGRLGISLVPTVSVGMHRRVIFVKQSFFVNQIPICIPNEDVGNEKKRYVGADLCVCP